MSCQIVCARQYVLMSLSSWSALFTSVQFKSKKLLKCHSSSQPFVRGYTRHVNDHTMSEKHYLLTFVQLAHAGRDILTKKAPQNVSDCRISTPLRNPPPVPSNHLTLLLNG